jgi:hypothetical protein
MMVISDLPFPARTRAMVVQHSAAGNFRVEQFSSRLFSVQSGAGENSDRSESWPWRARLASTRAGINFAETQPTRN